MSHISLWQFVILVIIFLIFLATRQRGGRWLHSCREYLNGLSHLTEALQHELKSVFPIFSAETVDSREAEFVSDSLPKRFPIWIIAAAAAVALAIVAWWWITT